MWFLLCLKTISKHGKFARENRGKKMLSAKTVIFPHLHAFTPSKIPKINPTTLSQEIVS